MLAGLVQKKIIRLYGEVLTLAFFQHALHSTIHCRKKVIVLFMNFLQT